MLITDRYCRKCSAELFASALSRICLAVGFCIQQSVLPPHSTYSTLVTQIPPHSSTALRLASGRVLKINNGWLLSGIRSCGSFYRSGLSVSSVFLFRQRCYITGSLDQRGLQPSVQCEWVDQLPVNGCLQLEKQLGAVAARCGWHGAVPGPIATDL